MRDVLALLIVALVTALVGGITWLLSRSGPQPMPAWRRHRRQASTHPMDDASSARIDTGLPLVGIAVGLFLLWSASRTLMADGWLLAGYILGAILGVSATMAHAHSHLRDDDDIEDDAT